MPKVKLGSVSLVADGEMKGIEVEGKDIVVSRFGGQYYAIDGICSHRGGSLGDGQLEAQQVTCPLHAAIYDLTTGKVSPDTSWATDQACFPVTVEGDELFVTLP